MATYEKDIYDLIERIKNQVRASPLVLGGVSSSNGGVGGPPGGLIGYLPQSRVAGDFTEQDNVFTSISGTSSGITLVTNLNNIRYRIKALEGADVSGITIVGDSFNQTGVTTITISGASLTDLGSNNVLVTIDAVASSGISWDTVTDKPTSFTPSAHNTSHQAGGTDIIKLDDLGTPDDNTDLDASASRHGLLPKLSNGAIDFLNGQGDWVSISGGSGGHSIQDEGSDVTPRTVLNFVGEGVTVTDDSINGATVVTIVATSGGGTGDMLKSVYDTDNDGIVDVAETAPWAGITGKPSTFTATTHHTSHESGGADAIKLDALATPDDTLTLNASAARHGLLPKLSGNSGEFLSGLGTWVVVGSGGGSGHTIQDEGANLATRANLNFVGAGVTVTDDSGSNATVVTIIPGSGAGGGTTITNTEIRTMLFEVTCSGGETSISTNLSQDYDDLEILCLGKLNTGTTALFLEVYFSGDLTDGNYFSARNLWSTSVANSDSIYDIPHIATLPAGTSTANYYGHFKSSIPRYAVSGIFNKMLHTESFHRHAATASYGETFDLQWENTGPITSLTFVPGSAANFATGSYIRVTGIKYGSVLAP